MNKQTLSNYGWIVIVTLVLSVMLALATPFGTYVGDGIVGVVNGFVGTSNSSLDDDNIKNLSNKWEEKLNNGISDDTPSYDHNAPELHPSGVIPEGATYQVSGETNPLTAGSNFPQTINDYDTYTYGDYVYTYRAQYNGWNVALNWEITDTSKTSYGAILESINNSPITTLENTFSYCQSLLITPEIPNSVTHLKGTFTLCQSLETAPKIPDGVTDMYATFQNCYNLTTAPVVPDSVIDMSYTFAGCTSLDVAPVIPSNVTDIGWCFSGCNALVTAPEIPNSVITMDYAFSGCISLIATPKIPDSVTDMSNAFYGCTSLTIVTTIPSSVTNIERTFEGCTALKGAITINANPTNYGFCLNKTGITEILGDCSETTKTNLLNTR